MKIMGAAEKIQKQYITVEEYFEMEERSEIRHEYYDGEIRAMAGTTLKHNKIVLNIASFIRSKFRTKGCEIFAESIKLEAIKHFYYPYPDVMLTCDKEDIDADYIIKNPSLIVEVLSKSTAQHDRTFKLRKYKTIPSVQYYLIVSQHEYIVEVFSRFEDSDSWLYDAYENENDVINFNKIDLTLSLSDIYEGIKMREEDKEREEDYFLKE
jgi:Uma2 family endonuclease